MPAMSFEKPDVNGLSVKLHKEEAVLETLREVSFTEGCASFRGKRECGFYIVYFKMATLMSTKKQPAQADSQVLFLYTLNLV